MTDRELLTQALEVLEKIIPDDSGHWPMQDTAVIALRERLAQPEQEQEPVAWMYVNMDGECEQIEYLEGDPIPDDPSITPLYTTPPRREWVGLTGEEIQDLWIENHNNGGATDAFARAVEAKLREKNT